MCWISIPFEHFTAVIAQEAPPNDGISVEILLRGGTVIDGTGGASRKGDVAIKNGKLLLPTPDQCVEPAWELDCSGLIICPGFIALAQSMSANITITLTNMALERTSRISFPKVVYGKLSWTPNDWNQQSRN